MILVYGDVHRVFKHVIDTVKSHKPEAIILLGDLQADKPLHEVLKSILKLTNVYFIHGNHDTDSVSDYTNLFESEIADRNLHGRVVDICGYKVAGLGGVFRDEIWFPKSNEDAEVLYENYDSYFGRQLIINSHQSVQDEVLASRALKHKSSIFYEDWFELADQSCDVLVTHEAPSCHPYGFVGIDVLARTMKAKKTFHGHHHDRLDYSGLSEKLGFEAFGVGLRGVSDINGVVVKHGESDAARMNRKLNINLCVAH